MDDRVFRSQPHGLVARRERRSVVAGFESRERVVEGSLGFGGRVGRGGGSLCRVDAADVFHGRLVGGHGDRLAVVVG